MIYKLSLISTTFKQFQNNSKFEKAHSPCFEKLKTFNPIPKFKIHEISQKVNTKPKLQFPTCCGNFSKQFRFNS